MNDTLIYGLATLGAGVLGLIVRYTFKSKCSDLSLCFGLISVKRDTEAEVKDQQNELEMGAGKRSPSLNNLAV